MKRILFVDDEQRVLDGLQRMLRPQRRQWDMVFAVGGEAALTELERQSFDIVVSDIRMPGIDGAQLLEIVRQRYPGVVRMVLSGYFERDYAVRASPVAHQFLVKPCESEKLISALERACSLSVILAHEGTREAVAALGELPCLPRTYTSLVQALEKPDVSLKEVSRIVERDVGVSAKVLQLVNSAFFGLGQEITTVQAAVGYLGLDVLNQLVLTIELFQAFKPVERVTGFSLAEVEDHCRLTAAIASRLPLPKSLAVAVPGSALLHDAGQLVLATKLSAEFESAIRTAIAERKPRHLAEERLLGASHAEVGAYLLGLWGLPGCIVEAVMHHHAPGRVAAEAGLNLPTAVHVADCLAHACHPATGGAPPPELDLAHLERLGLADQVPAWTAMAEEVAGRVVEEQGA